MKNYISVLILVMFISVCNPAQSQSSNDATKINDWQKTIGGSIVVSGDICDLLNGYGTGPFDPTQCWEKQLLALSQQQKSVRGNSEITDILMGEHKRIKQYLQVFRTLSPKEKEKRDKIFEALIKEVRQSNGNMKTGLGKIVNSPTSGSNQKETAKKILTKSGTKGCVVPDCVCVVAEGCPCCGYDTITKEIYGTKILF